VVGKTPARGPIDVLARTRRFCKHSSYLVQGQPNRNHSFIYHLSKSLSSATSASSSWDCDSKKHVKHTQYEPTSSAYNTSRVSYRASMSTSNSNLATDASASAAAHQHSEFGLRRAALVGEIGEVSLDNPSSYTPCRHTEVSPHITFRVMAGESRIRNKTRKTSPPLCGVSFHTVRHRVQALICHGICMHTSTNTTILTDRLLTSAPRVQSLEQVLAQINALNRSLEGIIEVRTLLCSSYPDSSSSSSSFVQRHGMHLVASVSV
jgi:hypothetical protein